MSSTPPPSHVAAWAAPAVPLTPRAADTSRSRIRSLASRAWSIFLVVACGLLAMSAAGNHMDADSTFPGEWYFYLFAGAVGMSAASVLLIWRRRRPNLVVMVLAGITCVIPTTPLPALIALAAVTEARRGWWRWASIAAVYGATLIAVFWDLAAASPTLFAFVDSAQAMPEQARTSMRAFAPLTAAVLVAPFVAWGMFRAVRYERDAARRGSDAAAHNVATLHGEVSRERERLELSRELHDTLSASLGTLSLHAGALELSATDSASTTSAARAIRESAQNAFDELHDFVDRMRHPERTTRARTELADLGKLISDVTAEGTDVRVQILIDDPSSCDPAVSHTCFRIVQEAISNVRRHAPTAALRIDVRGGPETGLTISATNWVPTGSTVSPDRHGLRGMSERVAQVGGTFQAGLTQGNIFAVASWLPWRPPKLAK